MDEDKAKEIYEKFSEIRKYIPGLMLECRGKRYYILLDNKDIFFVEGSSVGIFNSLFSFIIGVEMCKDHTSLFQKLKKL